MRESQAGQNHEKDKALRQAEDKYHRLVNQMLAAYALHEIICNDQGQPIDYRFLEVNSAFEQMTGFKAESIVGRSVLEVMPQTEPNWIEKYGKVALTGEPIHFEDFSRQLNRYFEVIAFRPAPNQFACSFTDITERKQAEDALRQSNELLSLFIRNSPIYAFIKEVSPTESRVLMASENYQDMIGIPGSEMAGRSMEELFPAELAAKFTVDDWAVVSSGKVLRVDEDLNGHNYTTVKFPIFLGGKNLLAGYTIDITERTQAELALTAEKERLAVTLHSIGDGVITTDTNGAIVMLNKVAEELTGWNSNKAAGRPLPEVFNIINELTRQPCENPVERVLTTGAIVELANHTCLIARDGREIVIADSGAPIHDNQSRVVGVVLVFRDMTEKQKLEDFMQKSQKLESLGVLAGGIAHDFNNLLGAIFGYTELAIAKTREEEVSTYLAKSVNTIDRARALTEQLLTFAKGGAPIRKVENLFPFVQETVQFALSGSAVSSRFQIQENLWACDFDKNQIGQVIDNLTINAQQAMPTGGTIEISARNISLSAKEHISLAAGNYVRLSLKDQGIGIPKEFLPRIFDPYYTTKTKGHGLGLATCYSIVTRHDGWIDVESEPGKGSTFHVYLPASIESSSSIAGNSAEEHTGSGTFLVMDDEKAMGEVIREVLESFGYTVVLKKNGEDAIDFCVTETKANRKLAGMLFDLTIPGGMGGKEAIREIRKICPDTPAFVASGYSVDPIIANPQEYGFNASLPKPFTIDELSDMLDKHLKKPE